MLTPRAGYVQRAAWINPRDRSKSAQGVEYVDSEELWKHHENIHTHTSCEIRWTSHETIRTLNKNRKSLSDLRRCKKKSLSALIPDTGRVRLSSRRRERWENKQNSKSAAGPTVSSGSSLAFCFMDYILYTFELRPYQCVGYRNTDLYSFVVHVNRILIDR